MARFGDGELAIAAYGSGIGFQEADKELQKALNSIIKDENPHILLCLPGRINYARKKDRAGIPEYWQKQLPRHYHMWTRHFSRTYRYGETNVSRLVLGKTDKEKYELIAHIKLLWERRDVILIEGEKTRFGVGNDLLDNAKSVCRILGPAESAFRCRKKLCDAAVAQMQKLDDPIVIMALGPTATVLASDISKLGGQAVDLGHLDISLEHLSAGNTSAVKGKYTNEAADGNMVGDCLDENYQSQIIAKIGC